jgi:hypothetical protein
MNDISELKELNDVSDMNEYNLHMNKYDPLRVTLKNGKYEKSQNTEL